MMGIPELFVVLFGGLLCIINPAISVICLVFVYLTYDKVKKLEEKLNSQP